MSQLTGHVLGSSDRKGIGTYDWKGLHTTDWKGLGNPLKMKLIFVHTEIITITMHITSLFYLSSVSFSVSLCLSLSPLVKRKKEGSREYST